MSLKPQQKLFKNHLMATILLLVMITVGTYFVLIERVLSSKIVNNQEKEPKVVASILVSDESAILKLQIEEEQASKARLVGQQTAAHSEIVRLNEQIEAVENDLVAREKEVKSLQATIKQ